MRCLRRTGLAFFAVALVAGCSADREDLGDDDGTPRDGGAVSRDGGEVRDAGPRDGGVEPDSGVEPDGGDEPDGGRDGGEPRDGGRDGGAPRDGGRDGGVRDGGGVPTQCSVDQDCPSGNVCNFATTPRSCVPGRACTSNADCDICSDINPMQRLDCGQGIYVTATCDAAHGSVCVRGRGLCEPCQTDAECGRLHPIFGGGTKSCVVYPDGNRYCTRPCPNCPDGMVCDSSSNLCTRFSGCGAMPIYCPLNPNPASTCGSGQICEGETCPNTGGARCATNNQPGEIGLCLGFCTQDADCPATLPICNLANGNCIAGCTPASCPSSQVCHADGYCRPPCSTDADCTAAEFCNVPGGVGPRAFKSYRDTNACAPLGCERPADCPGGTCDTTQSPPACI